MIVEKIDNISDEKTSSEDNQKDNLKDYDFGEMSEVMNTYNISSNKGEFISNGLSFGIRPVRTEEFEEYFSVLEATSSFKKDEDKKQKRIMLLSLFSEIGEKNGDKSKFGKLINEFCFKFFKSYIRYRKYPYAMQLAKWIEKLVTYKGKKVRFYDLESKYNFTKDNIAELIIYINELSGFM